MRVTCFWRLSLDPLPLKKIVLLSVDSQSTLVEGVERTRPVAFARCTSKYEQLVVNY